MGFHLITANNGWAMALTGAIIVMLGLSSLALIISQLHRVLLLFEAKKSPRANETAQDDAPAVSIALDWLADPDSVARLCQVFTTHLGGAFKLTTLYKELERMDCPHPHLTIRALRENGQLLPSGEGLFGWQVTY